MGSLFVVPCPTCGEQPNVERCEYTQCIVVTCHNCDDADYEYDRGFRQTNIVVQGSTVLEAVEEWNQEVYETLDS